MGKPLENTAISPLSGEIAVLSHFWGKIYSNFLASPTLSQILAFTTSIFRAVILRAEDPGRAMWAAVPSAAGPLASIIYWRSTTIVQKWIIVVDLFRRRRWHLFYINICFFLGRVKFPIRVKTSARVSGLKISSAAELLYQKPRR